MGPSIPQPTSRAEGGAILRTVTRPRTRILQRLLPWAVSAACLGWVFGHATDWQALGAATRDANLPLFIALTTLDKLIFFLWWGVLQAAAVRRFVMPVSSREVIAIRGGAELVRGVNGALADATFMYGVAQLARGRSGAVAAAVGVPILCHFLVLLVQVTLALGLLASGRLADHDVVIAVGAGWTVLAASALALRLGWWRGLLSKTPMRALVQNLSVRGLLPFLGWFCLLAAFDVLIQGLASRAFGVPISWAALAARIPIFYVLISAPSFGNFGTRELAWATLFADQGPRNTLIAYGLATNTVFLILHVVIGVAFLPRALALIAEVRRARREGREIPELPLHDASDP